MLNPHLPLVQSTIPHLYHILIIFSRCFFSRIGVIAAAHPVGDGQAHQEVCDALRWNQGPACGLVRWRSCVCQLVGSPHVGSKNHTPVFQTREEASREWMEAFRPIAPDGFAGG